MSATSASTAERASAPPSYVPRPAREAARLPAATRPIVTAPAAPAPTAPASVAPRPDPAAVRPGRWGARALYALQLTLAAVFVVAGVAALTDAPAIAAQFGTIENATGLGAWLRTATGLVEVAGGVLLLARASAGVGAVLLSAVMAVAVAAEVLVLRAAPTAPVLLGVALALVAYAHRASLATTAAFLERNL